MAHILLIDDDDAVRTVLRLTLTHFGHHVTEARNGKEGLKLFGETAPDLVVTDIIMPEMEGLEFLMKLRNNLPPPKIIAISGGGRGTATEYLHLAKKFGAARVLAKPFSNEILLATIDDLLRAGALDVVGL